MHSSLGPLGAREGKYGDRSEQRAPTLPPHLLIAAGTWDIHRNERISQILRSYPSTCRSTSISTLYVALTSPMADEIRSLIEIDIKMRDRDLDRKKHRQMRTKVLQQQILMLAKQEADLPMS